MAFTELPPELTPREYEEMRYQEEQEKRQIEYNLQIKKLDIEVRKIEAQWKTWFKIPLYILKLPLIVLLGLAYIVHVLMKSEPSQDFWKLLH